MAFGVKGAGTQYRLLYGTREVGAASAKGGTYKDSAKYRWQTKP